MCTHRCRIYSQIDQILWRGLSAFCQAIVDQQTPMRLKATASSQSGRCSSYSYRGFGGALAYVLQLYNNYIFKALPGLLIEVVRSIESIN
jgi:hypothetical protein